MANEWLSVATNPPTNREIVRTIIMDDQGARNDQPLKRSGNLWFLPDGSMYVYYTPTHWMQMQETPK